MDMQPLVLISLFAHTFPHIPLRDAIRHIHTPERAVALYDLQPQGFRILDAKAPHITREGYHTIAFNYTHCLGGSRHGLLFAREPCTSHMLFYEDGMPHIMATLRAQSAGRTGHRMVVTARYLSRPSIMESILMTRPSPKADIVEQAISIEARTHAHADAHPQLCVYRWRVMALRDAA